MSRRPSRRQERRFRGRGYDVPAHTLDIGIGIGSPSASASVAPAVTPMEADVLRVLASREHVWRGDDDGRGMTTGAVASVLGIRARTPRRDALSETLTALRRRGLVHFEFDRLADSEVRWWATEQGEAAVG